ncbi:MAG: tetratricopeptide repeat protein [Patescibacteria group bacterium]
MNKKFRPIIFLVLIGFFIYAFNFANPLFWDDDEWIKGNVFVHDFSYLKEIFTQNVEAGFGLTSNYYRPLLLLSFAFNYVFGAENPFSYHLLSNGLHITNGILVFILLSRFLSQRASFIASVLFLIHPAQTEAVTYISGRGDPMSVFFMLLAIWLFIKSLNIEIFKSRYIFKFLSLISVILAILSRETAILFPLLLMIFYISFLSKEKLIPVLKKSFIVSLPFWAVSIFYFILRLTVFNFENTLNFFSQPTPYSENLSFRLFTFGSALVEYFKILFVPVGLHMERSLLVNTSFFQWPVYLAAIIVLGILYLVFHFYKREKIWFFSWSWFFAALAPVSGIIPINAIIYEHWLYLPMIGFAALAGFYIDRLFSFLKSKNLVVSYKLLVVSLIIYFSFFAVQSIRRNIIWGNPVKFYEDILKYSPSSVRIMTNLGNLYSARGDLARAEDLFKRAIENPESGIFAQPHYNLGNLFRDTGRIDEAIEQYKKAIETDPNFPFAYQNLAVLLINKKQDLVSGIEILEKLKEVQPGNPRVYYNLGLLYLATNNPELAVQNLELGFNFAKGRDSETEKAIAEVLSKIK